MSQHHLIEKKKYTFEQLIDLITEHKTVYLDDLIDCDIDDGLFTIFLNHCVVIKDVEQLSLISYDDTYIHGIVDVYDRMQRERDYNIHNPASIENDNISDLLIRSDIVINVIELNAHNFIQESEDDLTALKNNYLIELYTDWHTQLHFKDNLFFKYFYD